MNNHTQHQNIAPIIFGIFSILSFVSYAMGMELMQVVQDFNSTPSYIVANTNAVISGGILVAIVHTLLNAVFVTLMVTILQPINNILTRLYYVFALSATMLLAIGAIFLMLPLSVGKDIITIPGHDVHFFRSFLQWCNSGNFYLYQIGMAIWGLGGIMLCCVLYTSKVVPRLLSVWGLGSYPLFIAGTIAELFGYPIGILLSMPGGLFEITLGLWFIFKGFTHHKLV